MHIFEPLAYIRLKILLVNVGRGRGFYSCHYGVFDGRVGKTFSRIAVAAQRHVVNPVIQHSDIAKIFRHIEKGKVGIVGSVV